MIGQFEFFFETPLGCRATCAGCGIPLLHVAQWYGDQPALLVQKPGTQEVLACCSTVCQQDVVIRELGNVLYLVLSREDPGPELPLPCS